MAALVDRLASVAPDFQLPEGGVHSHTRHYMPAGRKTSLVFDAFVRLPRGAEVVAVWPHLDLDRRLFGLASELAVGIGYLGRAESWTECRATAAWEGEINCGTNSSAASEERLVRVLVPLTPAAYARERQRRIAPICEQSDENLAARAVASGKRPPTAKRLRTGRRTAVRKAFGATLPEGLLAAMSLDSADLKKHGWSRPPASREVIYYPPPLGPLPRRRAMPSDPDDRQRHTVARFVLAGRPRPRVEETVRIGELMRLAALARFGWDGSGSQRRPKAPPEISGRGPDGKPLPDPRHSHTFWLPEDADADGWIDHISLYCRSGFGRGVRARLDGLTRLWLQKKNGIEMGARREWRPAAPLARCIPVVRPFPSLGERDAVPGRRPPQEGSRVPRRGAAAVAPTEAALRRSRSESPGAGDPDDFSFGISSKGRALSSVSQQGARAPA